MNASDSHPVYRVGHFELVGPYTVKVRFDDGSAQEIDFRPVLEGELFGPLQDEKLCNAVTLDPEVGTLTWPNGADFDPATLHDWPTVREQFVQMARECAKRSSAAQQTSSR